MTTPNPKEPMTVTNEMIHATWIGFEADEPDISTERLIEQTMQATGITHERFMEWWKILPDAKQENP